MSGSLVTSSILTNTNHTDCPRSIEFILALSAAAAGFILLLVTIIDTNWVPAKSRGGDFSVTFLGENILKQFFLSFELISVLLLTAIIGALIIANIGRDDNTHN